MSGPTTANHRARIERQHLRPRPAPATTQRDNISTTAGGRRRTNGAHHRPSASRCDVGAHRERQRSHPDARPIYMKAL